MPPRLDFRLAYDLMHRREDESRPENLSICDCGNVTADCIMGVVKTPMTAKTLPHTRKSSLGKVDLSREREWILQHRHSYLGEWVVLGDGNLLGHSADSADVATIVDEARALGIETPYVKFISEDSEPIWMGWL